MTGSGASDRAVADVEEILQQRARALAIPRGAGEPGGRSAELHLIVRIGDRMVALPAARVSQVVRPSPLARLVGCGAAISGLAVVHGELVQIADVSAVLHPGADARPRSASHFVVLDDEESSIGLLVDEVVELRPLHPDEVAADSSGHRSVAIVGVASDGVFVLDTDVLLADPRLRPPAAEAGPGAGGLRG